MLEEGQAVYARLKRTLSTNQPALEVASGCRDHSRSRTNRLPEVQKHRRENQTRYTGNVIAKGNEQISATDDRLLEIDREHFHDMLQIT